MIPRVVVHWFTAFVFTQLVEVPIYRRTLTPGFFAAFGASAVTHPLVWLFLRSHVWDAPWGMQAAVVELFAWWAEALYFVVFFRCHKKRALGWTLAANGASFGLGLVSHAALGWP